MNFFISEGMSKKLNSVLDRVNKEIADKKELYKSKKGSDLLECFKEEEIIEYEKSIKLKLPSNLREYLTTISREFIYPDENFMVELHVPIIALNLDENNEEIINHCLQIKSDTCICIGSSNRGKLCILEDVLLERVVLEKNIKVYYYNIKEFLNENKKIMYI